ncbi:NAD(P)-binding domain-containing protein [Achromobacter marplatensis]|uniref:NAD(P)-binding domain-containing protein n=1 Tax=Achromobacter marplatensis TaxID=470868 RepID=UPI0039F70D21
MALALQKVPGLKLGVLEAGRVGESFRRWPAQTRFMAFIAKGYDLPIAGNCKVEAVGAVPGGGFILDTPKGQLQAGFLIWATGEFQFPELAPFRGAQWCAHYAQVADWQRMKASRYTVIGGYESGVDAAVNLVKRGRNVRQLARKSTWDPHSPHDPACRSRPIAGNGSTRRSTPAGSTSSSAWTSSASRKTRAADFGSMPAMAATGTTNRPRSWARGFLKGGGAQQIAELWDWDHDGRVMLTEADESTLTPGLFLVIW